MSNRPALSAPALAPDACTLESHIEELRAELANCLSRRERRQIEAQLRAA
jgi:hypothetical protein